jgi:hypothetical protein
MRVAIVEANMNGTQHSYPNGVYVKIIANIFKDNKVDLYCAYDHLKCMGLNKSLPSNVKFHPIKVVSSNEQNMIKKFSLEFRNTFNILNNSKADLVIFLSSFPDIQLPVLKSAKRWPNRKIIIFTHGELEGLIMPTKWKIWSYPFWMSQCFKHNLPENIYRIVLGKSIKEWLDNKYGYRNIFYIDQPRDGFSENNSIKPETKNNTFAFVGDCSESKGGRSMEKLARSLKQSNSKVEIIGRYLIDVDNNQKNLVLTGTKDKFLPLAEYDSLIEKTTYVCLPYPKDTYQLTASGAVLDAVRHLKPIIYIENNYFDGIFEGAGDIGYRCANEEDFIKTVNDLDNNSNPEQYNRQVSNLKKLQKKFSVENVTAQMKDIFDTVVGDIL